MEKNKQKMAKNTLKKIETIVKCPGCGTKIDFSGLTEEIKCKLEQEIERILKEI